MIGKTVMALAGCVLAIATMVVVHTRAAHASGPCYGVCQLEGAATAVQGSHIAVVTRATNHEELFWVAPDGSVQDTYTYGGGVWGNIQLAPKGSAAACPGWPITAVSRASNTMEVFWIDPYGSVHDAAYYDGIGWSGLGSNPALSLIAGPGSADSTYCPGLTSVSRASNRLEVLWVAPDGSIQDSSWLSGYSWQRHAQISDYAANGGVNNLYDFGGITAISRAGNTVELFWMNIGKVRHAWFYDGADWSAPEDLPTVQNTLGGAYGGGGGAYAGLTAVSRRSDTMEVFWVAHDGSIQDAWWYDSVGQWQQAARTGSNAMPVKYLNGRSVFPGPSLAAVAPEPRTGNSLMTFFPSGDRSIQVLEWYQGGCCWNQYAAAAAGSNTAKTYNSISVIHSALNDTVDVFWIDDDGSIQHAYW